MNDGPTASNLDIFRQTIAMKVQNKHRITIGVSFGGCRKTWIGIQLTALLKPLIGCISVLAIAGCTGTGTTDKNEINTLIQNADGNTAIVARSTGFTGSAPRIFVLMDDEQVAALGSNEVGTFQASRGEHTLSIDFEGPSIGLRTNTLTYVNDPSRTQFFVITLESKLLGADMTISEVSANSFPSFVR